MSTDFIQRYWVSWFIIGALVMYFFAYAGYRVQEDARKRGLGKAAVTFWSVATVFFGFIFLPLYLMFRARAVFAKPSGEESADREMYRLCPHCGTSNPVDQKVCDKCRKIIDSMVSVTGNKTCTYCGAENPLEAARCKACDQVIGYVSSEEDEN